jgi:hypothetical protein
MARRHHPSGPERAFSDTHPNGVSSKPPIDCRLGVGGADAVDN